MRKSTTSRTWLTGLGFMIAGAVVLGIGIGLMLTNAGTWTPAPSHGYDFHPDFSGFFYGTVAMVATGGFIFFIGVVLQFVAWIGAMINTAHAADKTWFVLLLVLGLIGFQFIIMIVYLIAGPDARWTPPAVLPAPPPVAPPQPPAYFAA